MVSITCTKYIRHCYFHDPCIASKCFEAAMCLFGYSSVTCQVQFGASFILVVWYQQSPLLTLKLTEIKEPMLKYDPSCREGSTSRIISTDINSFWPNYTIWRHGIRATLAQAMAYCPTAEAIAWSNIDFSLVKLFDIHPNQHIGAVNSSLIRIFRKG